MVERRARPFLIGLTGSVGMGKSETAKMFERLGIPVYDADKAVGEVYGPGGAAVGAIGLAFPAAIKNGAVDRQALSDIVTGDPGAFQRLEEIVHPLVRNVREAFLEKASADDVPIAILDIPLLFETGSEKDVDATIVVSAPKEVQRARVLARPGMTEEKFAALWARQIPDDEKRAKADFVIDTSKGLDHAAAQVEAILSTIQERLG
nr:MAG: dephospho-CoA kinase [Hyphomicrobiales bacterium]